MKKRLLNLFKSNKITNSFNLCDFHRENQLKSNEYCNSCNLSFCYKCGNDHFDMHCNVSWGNDLVLLPNAINYHNEKNMKFNLGYPFVIDLTNLKCPCGTEFLNNENSAICSACGIATCSPECHYKYAEEIEACGFNLNYAIDESQDNNNIIDEENKKNKISGILKKVFNFLGSSNESNSIENSNDNKYNNTNKKSINSLMSIKAKILIESIKNNFPPYTKNSDIPTKFIHSYTGPVPFTIILQRGFRQYGQPHLTTLEYMNELTGEKGLEMYDKLASKLCICECNSCKNRSPHPVYNCVATCENIEELSENEKIDLRFYSKCRCICGYCISLGHHLIETCMYICISNKKKML